MSGKKQQCELQISDRCDKDLMYGQNISYDTGKKVVRCIYCPHPKEIQGADAIRIKTKVTGDRISGIFKDEKTGELFGTDRDNPEKVYREDEMPYNRNDPHGHKYTGKVPKNRKTFRMGK